MLSEYIPNLANVNFHIVAYMYARFRYSGKNPMRFAVFWRISVRFCGFRTPLTPPSYFSPKKLFFTGRNYIIIQLTLKRFVKNLFQFCVLLSSVLFIWNWNDKYAHTLPVVPLKQMLDSRPKWAKSIPARFQTTTTQKPNPLGWHILYSAYIREYSPLPDVNAT